MAQAERTKAPFTALELLLLQLMNDEMVNLIAYKIARAGGERKELSPTRLDRVIALWQEVFPGNKVLIDSGKILFSRNVSPSDANVFAVEPSSGRTRRLLVLLHHTRHRIRGFKKWCSGYMGARL